MSACDGWLRHLLHQCRRADKLVQCKSLVVVHSVHSGSSTTNIALKAMSLQVQVER